MILVDYLKKYLLIILELGKVRITAFVAISTSVGYILYSGVLDLGIIAPSIGVFLLAAGSSSINHLQEKKYDCLMERTKGRPLPSGKVDFTTALLIGINLVLFGSVVLYYSSNGTALLLGWLALFWYNAFYTPLKRKYALAVVPGSLIGAIPPVIGWVAAGGQMLDMKILMVALFFFIWQIPHFWLLMLIHSKDYERAGFPTLVKLFSALQVSRITFVWIAALVFSCILIPLFGVSTNPYTPVALFLLGIWLLFATRKILTSYLEKMIFRKAFIMINLFVLAVVILISLDKLILIQF